MIKPFELLKHMLSSTNRTNPLESHPLRRNGLVLRRMSRRDETAWTRAGSWLGGSPRINPERWPRAPHNNLPLHHLGQIDLSELPEGIWRDVLPRDGALSFFIDLTYETHNPVCKVKYTQDPKTYYPIHPPTDCPPVGGAFWENEEINIRVRSADMAARVLRRWPVEFVPAAFALHDDEGVATVTPPLDDILGPSVNPNIFRIPDRLGEDERGAIEDIGLIPWEAARHVLENAAEVAPDSQLVANWQARVMREDPFAPMGGEAAAALEAELHVFRYEDKYRLKYGYVTTALRHAAHLVLYEMFTGPRDQYAAVPEPCRAFMRSHGRGTTEEGAHQMFGVPNNIQGNAYDYEQYILLFQADTDDCQQWMWGDVGVIQFWIKPEDLANWEWDRAFATITSH